MNEMITKYEKYLSELQARLDTYFDEQKDFLKCKAGCSCCCKFCYYPYSQLEYEYLRSGLLLLEKEELESIQQKALKVLKDKREFLKTNPNLMDFYYTCPLLADDKCGLYNYRGLLCRSFGLVHQDIENPRKYNAPYCIEMGLNYANVVDENTKKFSEEKAKALGFKVYDLSYSSLMRDAGEDIKFGDVRMLFEWIIMDIPGYEEIIKNI